MQLKTVWQQGSNNLENPNNLAIIGEWWQGLSGKEVFWQQRLIPNSGEVGELNWEPKRFDELFAIISPELRGITLYWRKPDSPQERNTTPHQLVLDRLHQQLYIFPQSQKELVIRVGLPTIKYQTIEVTNPEWNYVSNGNQQFLTLQDAGQQIEVKVTLSKENLKQLMRELLKENQG
jgi:hypothetical protein